MFVRRRQGWQIKAVSEHRKGACRARSKAAEIKGQPVTQQFQPVLLGRPQRVGPGCVSGKRIMAYADHLLASGIGPDRMAIGPLAPGKQQVQLGIMSALRL